MDIFSSPIQNRLWSRVIRQDGDGGHFFWVGAIADDGYGRFSINHHGRTDAVRPHRYTYALAHGCDLDSFGTLMHLCDIPLCVRATTDGLTHLVEGSTRENMLDRQMKGRTRNGNQFAWRGLPRERFAATSRALRKELLAHGTSRHDVLAALIAGNDPDAPTLF